MNRQEYRRIRQEREKLRDEEVFTSGQYLRLLKSLAKEITDGRFDRVDVSQKPEVSYLGWCDGKRVELNIANEVTQSFQTKELKSSSIIGILGHECGHYNYSNHALYEKYQKGILSGIWYPQPPATETEQEKEFMEEMKEYFQGKDEAALFIIRGAACLIWNILEDRYVEEQMCKRYPGSICRGILLNRQRDGERIPSLRTQVEEHYTELSIIINLIVQYALLGRINNWDGYQGELLTVLESIKPVIDRAARVTKESFRFQAANQILLKIWGILRKPIREIEEKKKQEEQNKRQGEQEEQDEGREGEPKGQEGEQKEQGEQNKEHGRNPKEQDGGQENQEKQNEDGEGKPDGHKEGQEEQGRGEKGRQEGAENSSQDSEAGPEGNQPEETSDARQVMDVLLSQTPRFLQKDAQEGKNQGMATDEAWEGRWPEESGETAGVCGSGPEGQPEDAGEDHKDGCGPETEGAGTMPVKSIELDGQLYGLLTELAKEKAMVQVCQETRREMQDLLEGIPFSAGHRKVKKVVKRSAALPDRLKEEYQQYAPQVKKAMKRLKAHLYPILKKQESRVEHKLWMGRRLDIRNVANPSGALFEKKNQKGQEPSAVLAVLIDMSGSMAGERMEYAKVTALCLYEFCKAAGIPITIYGHHTDGYRHARLEDETVFLHSLAEFGQKEDDRYRILQMQPEGSNRDGAALLFMGQKLLQRKEKHKILAIISDGLPNASYYRGEAAKRDLMQVKKNLMGEGITFLAAAIGTDREAIQSIYQESFLDISSMEKMPAMLAKQIIKYIRRY